MELKEIKGEFRFKKALGQNFITDVNLLSAIADDADISAEDVVVEIGTGAATLTKELAKRAKKVFSFEVDEDLKPLIAKMLGDVENVEILFKNVMKMKDEEIAEITGTHFKVVANLPYYITTPIIMRFVESGVFEIDSLTFMVQKEVADRICALPDTPDYGAITVAVALRGDAVTKRDVPKTCFYPVPKVDSAVVHITLADKYGRKDDKTLLRLMRCAFLMRRKTLVNNMVSSFPVTREMAAEILRSCGFDDRIRGEVLSVTDFISIADKLK